MEKKLIKVVFVFVLMLVLVGCSKKKKEVVEEKDNVESMVIKKENRILSDDVEIERKIEKIVSRSQKDFVKGELSLARKIPALLGERWKEKPGSKTKSKSYPKFVPDVGLRKFSFRGKKLTEFPSEIFKQTDLSELDLSGNLLTCIPEEISK